MDTKPTHGGSRPGSGRKTDPNKRVMIAVRLPIELVEKLRKEPDQTKLIEELLTQYFE